MLLTIGFNRLESAPIRPTIVPLVTNPLPDISKGMSVRIVGRHALETLQSNTKIMTKSGIAGTPFSEKQNSTTTVVAEKLSFITTLCPPIWLVSILLITERTITGVKE